MCGIVGYIGKNDPLPILIDGLKRLAYRGYDSAGVALQNGKGLQVYKTCGKLGDLLEILPATVPDMKAGIGHTRWATHGIPSSINAHPHRSAGVVVVHNGIIENHRVLKARLLAKGVTFVSDTDTEVIPHMISRYLKDGFTFRESLKKTTSELEGSYAIGAMSESEPDSIIIAKKGSPLVIGIGAGEYFFASDIPALLPHTNKLMFLEDEQVCMLTEKGPEVEQSGSHSPVQSENHNNVAEVDWTNSMAEKEGYDHFMMKEIHEQPHTVNSTVREWIDNPLELLEELGLTSEIVIGLRRLQIAACGTSYHAALIGKYILQSMAHIHADVEMASEYRYREPIIENGSTLMLSITQSGETADTLAAQREAKRRGARTLTICNVVGSTAAREADSVLYTRGGPEIGVASTKTFTAQMAALCLLTIALGIRRGRLFSEEVNPLRAQMKKMPELMQRTLQKDAEIRAIARKLIHAKGFLYLGRGINYPIALEGAQKLKEISYIQADGCAAGEIEHGPIALIEDGFPVVVLAPVDHVYEQNLSSIEAVRARGGRVIAITDERTTLAGKVDDLIEVPPTHPALSAFVNIIPLQLLAYHLAVPKGCNVDHPRNLAKSVNVG